MRVERNEKNGTLKKDGSVRWVLKQAGFSQNQMYRGKFIIMIDKKSMMKLRARLLTFD